MMRDWKDVDTSHTRRKPRRRAFDISANVVIALRCLVVAALLIGGLTMKAAINEAEALRAQVDQSCPVKPDSAVVGWHDRRTGKAKCDYRTQRSPIVLL